MSSGWKLEGKRHFITSYGAFSTNSSINYSKLAKYFIPIRVIMNKNANTIPDKVLDQTLSKITKATLRKEIYISIAPMWYIDDVKRQIKKRIYYQKDKYSDKKLDNHALINALIEYLIALKMFNDYYPLYVPETFAYHLDNNNVYNIELPSVMLRKEKFITRFVPYFKPIYDKSTKSYKLKVSSRTFLHPTSNYSGLYIVDDKFFAILFWLFKAYDNKMSREQVFNAYYEVKSLIETKLNKNPNIPSILINKYGIKEIVLIRGQNGIDHVEIIFDRKIAMRLKKLLKRMRGEIT